MSEFPTPELKQPSWLDRPLASLITFDWEKAIYLAFILVAIVSRFYMLGDRVVSHDESLHTQYSYQYYNGDGYSHTPLMHGPFLFHATAASFWLFGDNDLTSRIPVALLGVLLIAMPYFLRSWLGRAGALFASFFLLVSPFILYYSRYIRHDIYIIIWALIVFTATVYYQRKRNDHYLWWFAAGVALMFATKEVSFIYVATFGSFLILRALARMVGLDWKKGELAVLRMPIAVVVLGCALLGGGLFAAQTMDSAEISEITTDEQFAADPTAAVSAESESNLNLAHFAQVAGMITASVGLFLVLSALRPRIEHFAEYDLIVLYAALILPTTTALLSVLAGIDPNSFAMNACAAVNEATTPFGRFAGYFSGGCIGSSLGSPLVINSLFLVFLLIASIALGYWWGGRRYVVPAIIFHVIFGLFYTSLFTNNGGWYSGMVLSLGYWLDQQEVARGGQPAFYYLFVTPFYEFFPIIFSLLGIRFWMLRNNLSRTLGYWGGLLLSAYLGYAFTNWMLNRPVGGEGFSFGANLVILAIVIVAAGLQLYTQTQGESDRSLRRLATLMTVVALIAVVTGIANLPIDGMLTDPATGGQVLRETTRLPGLGVALVVIAIGIVYFFAVRSTQISEVEGHLSWRERFDPEVLTGFMPHLIWWLIVTWGAYSYAGEKMPWLSTHIVIPTALIAGWYLGQKVMDVQPAELFKTRSLALVGLAMASILIAVLTVQTILIEVDFGSQTLSNLTSMGALFGRIALLLAAVYFLQRVVASASPMLRGSVWLFGGFILLALLTIRFSYMANYVNGDSSTEFLVYAHGSPATKKQVMSQLDEISMRLEGDKSVRISFDNKSSWPYYWYLREYTNQHFFGENPDASITDSPVIIAGSDNWQAVENIIRDDYEATTYGYIWWPMEEYRNFSWSALFGINGDPNAERGVGSRQVRQAMWDIFFYRDYENYGNVFGGNFDAGEWPLRGDLKMYIRRDVLAKLWDSGATAAAYQPPVDPYATGEAVVSAETIFGSAGAADGQLNRPRNVAVSADGMVYVADTGNHRIQVFNPDGSFAFGFGEPVPAETAPGPAQFSEPWGITIDAQFVYVADTWNGRIQKFTLDGQFVDSFGTFAIADPSTDGALQFYGPRSVVVDNDKLYIIDTGNHRIQVLDVNGTYINQLGDNGFALGQFNEPVGIALNNDGTIYVAEAWSKRIQSIQAAELSAYYEWEVDAWDGNSLDNKPYIAVDNNNRIYVTDPEGHRVLIFNAIGEYLGRFGRFGTDSSSLSLPTGIATDTNNNVYVADADNNRVLKFAPIDLSAP